MAKNKTVYPKDFLAHVKSITNRRARIVIDHIMRFGFITTEDLEKEYNYSHPPRAARDVREAGIPLETFTTKSLSGKSIAAYRFGDLTQLNINRINGRILFSKSFKKTLYKECNGRCQICNGQFEERYLQIDHRVPYEISGDTEQRESTSFMMLCGSCNRAKSWSCENCINWTTLKQPQVCRECYWGCPEEYTHVAMDQMRRIDLQWKGVEIEYYDRMRAFASKDSISISSFIKQLIMRQTEE